MRLISATCHRKHRSSASGSDDNVARSIREREDNLLRSIGCSNINNAQSTYIPRRNISAAQSLSVHRLYSPIGHKRSVEHLGRLGSPASDRDEFLMRNASMARAVPGIGLRRTGRSFGQSTLPPSDFRHQADLSLARGHWGKQKCQRLFGARFLRSLQS